MSLAWQQLKQIYGDKLNLPEELCTDSVQHPATLVYCVDEWLANRRKDTPKQFIHRFEADKILGEVGPTSLLLFLTPNHTAAFCCLHGQLCEDWLPVLRSNPPNINQMLLRLALGGLPDIAWKTLPYRVRDVMHSAVIFNEDQVHLVAFHYSLLFRVSVTNSKGC